MKYGTLEMLYCSASGESKSMPSMPGRSIFTLRIATSPRAAAIFSITGAISPQGGH